MALAARIDILIGTRTSQMDKGFQRAKGHVTGLGSSLRVTTQGLLGFATAAGGVYAAVRALRAGAGEAIAFNKAMASSTAIMGDLDAKTERAMRSAARAAAYGRSAGQTDTAKAYYYLASAGMDAQQSIAALDQVVKFSQAGMFDLQTATDLATDAQSALGLTVKDAGANLANLTRVTDVLVKANTLANASVQQFSEALTTKSGASLRALGKDMEEGVAVLAAFADQGIKGTQAGTQFAIVLRDLQTKALENSKAFATHKIAVFDSRGEMRNMADIIADVERRLHGLSDAGQKAILMQLGFSDKSIAATQALIGTSAKIRDYEAALRDAAGTTDEVSSKQLPQFVGAMSKLWDILKGISSITFGPLLEGIGIAVHGILWPFEVIAGEIQKVNQEMRGVSTVGPAALDKTKAKAEQVADAFEGIGAAAADAGESIDTMLGKLQKRLAKDPHVMEFEARIKGLREAEAKWRERVITVGMDEGQKDLWQLEELGVLELKDLRAMIQLERERNAIVEIRSRFGHMLVQDMARLAGVADFGDMFGEDGGPIGPEYEQRLQRLHGIKQWAEDLVSPLDRIKQQFDDIILLMGTLGAEERPLLGAEKGQRALALLQDELTKLLDVKTEIERPLDWGGRIQGTAAAFRRELEGTALHVARGDRAAQYQPKMSPEEEAQRQEMISLLQQIEGRLKDMAPKESTI